MERLSGIRIGNHLLSQTDAPRMKEQCLLVATDEWGRRLVVGTVAAHPLNIRLAQARFGLGPATASPSSALPSESHAGFWFMEEALAHHRLAVQGSDEVGGFGDPSEQRLKDEE